MQLNPEFKSTRLSCTYFAKNGIVRMPRYISTAMITRISIIPKIIILLVVLDISQTISLISLPSSSGITLCSHQNDYRDNS
ncbi:Uncharacterised protein [uncultured archaeon]|nr:Uncharacterised protein [uncultured archaeon]